MQNYVPKLIRIDDAARSIKEKKYDGLVLFLGAGISWAPPSNCPTWKSLLALCMNASQKAYPELSSFYSLVSSQIEDMKPEVICQLLYNNLRGDFFGFLDILLKGYPNHNHFAIASLVRELPISTVLTTNFDIYIEDALQNAHIDYTVHIGAYKPKRQKEIPCRSPSKSPVSCVKIHGSVEDRASIIITLRQAGHELKSDLTSLLSQALQSHRFLVVGYSGNDDDIFPVFLQNAHRAKEVFWVLWNNESELAKNHNIRLFSQNCPSCRLVGANKKDVLLELVDNKEVIGKSDDGKSESQHEGFLYRWAQSTNVDCWKNFFCELALISNEPSRNISFIKTQSEDVSYASNDQWASTKAIMNHGRALLQLKEFDLASKALLKAADRYNAWARYRELMECLTLIVTEIPYKISWPHGDPLEKCAWLSGKTLEPYCLALYNYAAGVYFFREKKYAFSRRHLFEACGFAKRCGDLILLIKSLEALAELCVLTKEKKTKTESLEEIERLRTLLGIQSKALSLDEGSLLAECELAAKKAIKRTIIGESVIVLISSIIFGGLAALFLDDLFSKVATFAAIFITGAGVKIWNAKKIYIRFQSIDYS